MVNVLTWFQSHSKVQVFPICMSDWTGNTINSLHHSEDYTVYQILDVCRALMLSVSSASCSSLTEVEPDEIFCYCSPASTSRFDMLCFLKCFFFFARHQSKAWLSWPSSHIKPVWPLSSNITHHQMVCTILYMWRSLEIISLWIIHVVLTLMLQLLRSSLPPILMCDMNVLKCSWPVCEHLIK